MLQITDILKVGFKVVATALQLYLGIGKLQNKTELNIGRINLSVNSGRFAGHSDAVTPPKSQ